MSGFTGGKPPMKDPFGLPTDEDDACQADGEFDLSQLEPKMRSIAVAMPPMPHFGGGLRGLQQQQQQQQASGLRGAFFPYELKQAPSHVPKPITKTQQGASMASSAIISTGEETTGVRGFAAVQQEKEAALEVPALPFDCTIFPLEVCHFYTKKSAQELTGAIEEALQSHNVTYTFDAQRFKYCCEYFAGTNVVKFQVRVYRMPDGRLVVEFQRRQGCCLACSKIVGVIREALVPLEEEDRAAGKQAAFEPRVTEAAVFTQEAETVSNEVVESKLEDLRRCLSCGREDVKREFAKVLIPLSQLCPLSVRKDRAYAELICTLFKSEVEEVRLAAVSCVANIAASLKEQEEAVDELWFSDVLDTVVRALADACAHVRRESARALMYMSKRFARAIVSHGGLEPLRRHSECSDRTLSGYCSAAVHNLVSVC